MERKNKDRTVINKIGTKNDTKNQQNRTAPLKK
jgi:hypothetical protein